MKKLLLIAYFYPPLGGPGVQRPSKLVKHLHKQDVSTDVITVNDIVFHSTDNKLLKEDKAHKTIRTTSLDLMSILKKISKPKTNKAVYFSTPEKYKKIITVEEQCLSGGFGSSILEAISDLGMNNPVKRLGLEDRYYFENGGREYLLNTFGLSNQQLKDTIKSIS